MNTLSPPRTRAFVDQVMGLPVSVHVRAADTDRTDIVAAVANVFAHLRRVDAVLSPWRADSDLIRVRSGRLTADAAHPWLADVTSVCREAVTLTEGLFTDVLRGPDGTVGFDPTGVAKGWAVDSASAHLAEVPGIAWSVNAGGDLLCGVGRAMAGVESVWRIGIEDPYHRGQIAEVVPVSRGALATSGSAARGAHVVDPRTGDAVHRQGSVSVTGPSLTRADVWATAAWVDPTRAATLMAARDPAYVLRSH